jgi:hypothetical protein
LDRQEFLQQNIACGYHKERIARESKEACTLIVERSQAITKLIFLE